MSLLYYNRENCEFIDAPISKSQREIELGDFLTLDETDGVRPAQRGEVIVGVAVSKFNKETLLGSMPADTMSVLLSGRILISNYDKTKQYKLFDRIYINTQGRFENAFGSYGSGFSYDTYCGYVFSTPLEEDKTTGMDYEIRPAHHLGIYFNAFMREHGLKF